MGKRAYRVEDLINKKFDVLPFQHQWKKSLGRPCKQFSMMVMGESGHGKTEFTIMLAKYLTKFGTVAYNSIEQGLSHTLGLALERNNMQEVSNKFRILDESLEELTERLAKQRSPDFVVIDSLQYLKMSIEEYNDFKQKFKNKKGIIFISHMDGNEPKGATARHCKYDVDIHVKVKGFVAFASKRLNGGGNPYIINTERAAKYHGELLQEYV